MPLLYLAGKWHCCSPKSARSTSRCRLHEFTLVLAALTSLCLRGARFDGSLSKWHYWAYENPSRSWGGPLAVCEIISMPHYAALGSVIFVAFVHFFHSMLRPNCGKISCLLRFEQLNEKINNLLDHLCTWGCLCRLAHQTSQTVRQFVAVTNTSKIVFFLDKASSKTESVAWDFVPLIQCNSLKADLVRS